MRVEGNAGPEISLDATLRRREEAGGRSPAENGGAGAAGEDQATISGAHLRVQSLVAQVNQTPEVRQQRVAALAAAVRNGTYQASAGRTATAMIEQMRRA